MVFSDSLSALLSKDKQKPFWMPPASRRVLFLVEYEFLNSTILSDGFFIGSCTRPSGLAASHRLSNLITKPDFQVVMCEEVFCFYSRYLVLVDSSCKLPHLVAVFPSNLLYSNFFTVELTLVLALLFAMDPTFEVHLNFHLLRYLWNS